MALAVCSAVAAHGDGGALGFRSSVKGIVPGVPRVTVTVLDYDDRLELRNETREPLVVLGYEGEPYLVFRDGRVYRNARSPATYLNDERFGQTKLPARADAAAAPEWEVVSDQERYDWHDHRIHWMSRTLPPKIAEAKDVPRHVFDWVVPAMLSGKPLRIEGSLDYEPPPGQSFPKLLLVPLVAATGATVALWLRRRRREAR